jgi:hypothetical protein
LRAANAPSAFGQVLAGQANRRQHWSLGLSAYDPAIGPPPVLHHLQLRNVGPTPQLELALAPRLNLITGDNGLGKSFLLDAAWYCLMRRWPQELNPGLSSGAMALPRLRAEPAELAFRLDGDQHSRRTTAAASTWRRRPGSARPDGR